MTWPRTGVWTRTNVNRVRRVYRRETSGEQHVGRKFRSGGWSSHDVESRLRRQAASYYPDRSDQGSPEIVCTRTIDRGFSLRFEFTLNWADNPATRVIAKIRRDSVNDVFDQLQQTATAAALGRAEYDGLVRAYRYFSSGHAGLSVVRPLDYDDERNVLIVEHAAGRDLGVLVAARDPGCVKAFARCGRWLRLFHHDLHSSACAPGLRPRSTS